MGGKEQTKVLEAIRASDRRVVVLTGPARSGKTAAAIGLYEAYLKDPTAPACGLIVPNYLAVKTLRRRLLEGAPGGVLVAPLVMTFASLAERIAQAAGRSHRRISPTHRRAILGDIIASLAEGGELKVLAAVADTPGLVTAVDRAIAELKQAAVEPDALAEALGGANGRHADLLRIYRAYQAWMLDHDLYDEQGRMWQAREELSGLAAAPIPGLRAVVADGFTDFTPTQLAILRSLADHVERVVITLPYADEPRRRKLWRWTERQLGRIRNTFGDLAAHVALPAADDGPAGSLLGSLFAIDTPRAAWPDGLACVEAADPESECRAIARWVKARLAADARPDELAVLVRRRANLAPALRRVFREAGLPAPAAEWPLLATPPTRALLAVVTMACGFDSPDVLNVLACSYLDPASLGAFGPETLDAAQLTIRLQNVLGGRDRYARAAGRLAERLGGRDPDSPSVTPQEAYLIRLGPDALADAEAFFEALFARVDPIAAGGPPAALAAACRDLVGTLLHPGRGIAADEDLAEDLRAWSALTAVLDELGAGEATGGAAERTMTAGMLRQWLTAALAETPAPSTASSTAVRVTDVLDGRCLRAAHVWLAGVNEGAFPLPAAEGALIGEVDRRRWIRRHGLPLDARDDQAAREMLLFYLTCARADRTLTISYHGADADGGAAAASAFVETLLGPVESAERNLAALPLAEFAPPPERIVSWREFRNAAGASEGDGRAWQPAIDQGLLAPLARPLWAAHRRWAAEPPDRYDGVLDEATLLDALAATIPARCVLSVSRLNTY
ncbi:MAG: PD-(D/E)XK nuclease family protein, partial [Planctomycetota bacterium]